MKANHLGPSYFLPEFQPVDIGFWGLFDGDDPWILDDNRDVDIADRCESVQHVFAYQNLNDG